MNKKPAVAAKAAPRKRTIKAKPAKDFPLKNISKPVDWEKLCKRLQEALAKEMKDNEFLKDELSRKRSFFERLVCLATGTV